MANTSETRSDPKSSGDSKPGNISELRRGRYHAIIGVSGTPRFNDYTKFKKAINEYLVNEHKGSHIAFVTGDSNKGAELFLRNWASLTPFNHYVFTTEWEAVGKAALFIRNKEISNEITHLLVFWDKESQETKQLVKECNDKSLTIHVVPI